MECQDQSLVVISSGTAKPAQRANDECGPLPLQSADDGQLPIFSKSHEGRIWATSSPDVAQSSSSLTKYTGRNATSCRDTPTVLRNTRNATFSQVKSSSVVG